MKKQILVAFITTIIFLVICGFIIFPNAGGVILDIAGVVIGLFVIYNLVYDTIFLDDLDK